MKPIWIVDDDPSIRFVLEKALAREQLPTRSFVHSQEVLDALAQIDTQRGDALPLSALISDIRMPGGSGLRLLEQLHQAQPLLPVIIMTAYSDLDSAVAAFQRGAFEYLPKPFDVPKAVALIKRAVQQSENQVPELAQAAGNGAMLGQAPAMQEVFRAIGRLSQSSVTVLITGESGSGKELVAHALHKHSPMAEGPFVAINTAAIPKDLLESELFGHERGAFTGAQTQRRGRFEQAEGGTLFLDEIGDMPFELQTRLLRVLSDGYFYRVGGHVPVKSQVRVIAATHQNLEERVRQGGFREDLLHRLNVIRLRLPPLRERREDIAMLARHFLAASARQLGVEPKRLTDAALLRLGQFGFPGNVRQLQNVCHWISVMAPAQWVSEQDLPPEILQATAGETAAATTDVETVKNFDKKTALALTQKAPTAINTVAIDVQSDVQPNTHAMTNVVPPDAAWELELARQADTLLQAGAVQVWDVLSRRFETQLIKSALNATQGRRAEAAQRLGIGRNTITRKIQELGLSANEDEEREGFH